MKLGDVWENLTNGEIYGRQIFLAEGASKSDFTKSPKKNTTK